MSETFNEVSITTKQVLNRKAVEFYLKNGLLSMKRSGKGITIKCIPMSKQEERNLRVAKDEIKRNEGEAIRRT